MKHHNLQSSHFPGTHTALNIATMLRKSVEEDWGVDLHMQVPAFTTDNAKNVVNAVSENLMLVAIPCAGHSLNLAVQDALAVKGVKTALARAKKVVEHFNHSRLDSEELKVKQKQLDLPPHCLIQDVVTRWNSTLIWHHGCVNSRLPLQLFFMGSVTSTIWSFLLKNGMTLKTLLSYLSHLRMQRRSSVDRSIPHFLVLAQY